MATVVGFAVTLWEVNDEKTITFSIARIGHFPDRL